MCDFFVAVYLTIDLNTATVEEMSSSAGIGHGRAQTIFEWRVNLSRPLNLLHLLEIGIPADVGKALVDEEQDGGIEVQSIVSAALASLQRIASDVNGLSVAIDDVNRRQPHFESVRRAGGRIAGPKVKCGESNTKLMVMATKKCRTRGARQTYLAIVRDV